MENHFQARAPAPTLAPHRRLVDHRLGVAARDVWNWEGETMCGVLTSLNDGPSTIPWDFTMTCSPGLTCGGNTVYSVAGCCLNSSTCDFATTCWDRTKYLSSSSVVDNDPSARVKLCTDQSVQYCAEAYYNNGLNTFVCYTASGVVAGATIGPAAQVTTTPSGALPTSPTNVNHNVGSQATAPVASPSSTSVPASGPMLSTGAIVAIALAAAVVILGALAFAFFYRRSIQKKSQVQLQETAILRNELAQQRMSQLTAGQNNTAGWVNAQKPPAASVTEYNYSGETAYPVNHGGMPLGFYGNDGTVDGTVDNNPAPRI